MNETIPAGYRHDAKGNLIAEANIKPIDLLRDQLVQELIEEGIELQAALCAYKRGAFADIAALVETAADEYDARVGGKKGNVTLYSYDGAYKVQRQINERLQFDERIHAAQALINECLEEWTAHANPNLQAIVARAFETDKDGNLSATRILGLRRVKIDDPRWQSAMEAISDSVQVVGSRSYIRLYRRVGESCGYEPIPLDIAVV